MNEYFGYMGKMKAIFSFSMKEKNWKDKFIRKGLFCWGSLAIVALLLFAIIGCDKGKTEKTSERVPEQKLSQVQSFPLPQETNDLDLALEKVEDKGGVVEVAGWAAIDNQDSINVTKFFVLQSQNKSYIFDTFSLWKRNDVTQVYKINRDDSGFNVVIPKDKIEKGTYRAGIVVKKDKIISFQYFPGKTIKF